MMRTTIAVLGTAGLAVAAPAPLASGPASADPTTQTFSFTSASGSFTVPGEVCEITVDGFGAQGGVNPSDPGIGGSFPGLGGHATASRAVPPRGPRRAEEA